MALLSNIEIAIQESIQVAGAWLADVLAQDVSVECPEYHEGEGGHSPVGGIPFKESGEGMASIGWERMEGGVKVGVEPIRESGHNKEHHSYELTNHLIWHDPAFGGGVRPWLSNWQSRHLDEFMRVFNIALASRLRASQ